MLNRLRHARHRGEPLRGDRVHGASHGDVHDRGWRRGGRQHLADCLLDGRLNLNDLITARISLEQVNEGFAALKRGEAIRSVVVF